MMILQHTLRLTSTYPRMSPWLAHLGAPSRQPLAAIQQQHPDRGQPADGLQADAGAALHVQPDELSQRGANLRVDGQRDTVRNSACGDEADGHNK